MVPVHVAVITDKHHEHFVVQVSFFELLNHPPDILVHKLNAAVIRRPRSSRGSFARVPRCHLRRGGGRRVGRVVGVVHLVPVRGVVGVVADDPGGDWKGKGGVVVLVVEALGGVVRGVRPVERQFEEERVDVVVGVDIVTPKVAGNEAHRLARSPTRRMQKLFKLVRRSLPGIPRQVPALQRINPLPHNVRKELVVVVELLTQPVVQAKLLIALRDGHESHGVNAEVVFSD